MSNIASSSADGGDPKSKSLLLVDDDEVFRQRLGTALERRGFIVDTACSVAEGLAAIQDKAHAYAVVDMRLVDGSGLDVMSALKQRRPETRAIMLTGYGNICTAVTAVKRGAFDYLAKPADADEVCSALMASKHDEATIPDRLMTPDRVRYDHIQEVFENHGRNVSETARQLHMHRRTLQRILAKRAPF